LPLGCGFADAADTENSVEDSLPLPLKVVGSDVFNGKNEPVQLMGANCACLDWTSNGEAHIVQSVKTAVEDWNVNTVRLPMSQDHWFGRAPEQNDEGKSHHPLVKEIVDLCASRGVSIMLDLHWSDANEWGQNIGQHSMPDKNSASLASISSQEGDR
jgi:aryl-phospho-beta-D-glucosidase BglC (GH1 family)